MAIQSEVFRARLRETFGTEPQESTAQKLNMSQGNISKILSGNQQPTLETVYHIAKEYDVSVDWLLGLTDKKSIANGEGTYASVVEAIHALNSHGAATVEIPEKSGKSIITCDDPLLRYLLTKRNALYKADQEIFHDWMETKLSLFADKPILYSMAWTDQNVGYLTSEARTESNWLTVYEVAQKFLDDYADMMGPDTGPFSD